MNELPVDDESMAPFRFQPCTPRLSDQEAVYWKTVLARSAKVGVELEVVNPPGTEVEQVLRELTNRLRPSKDNRRFGEHGVLTVSRELVGVEVKVIGRVPVFDHFLGMLRTIYRHIEQTDCTVDGRCGMHHHLIAVQLGEDVPSSIFANVWNLTRWYAPALRFMTSAGPSREQLTRGRGYCDHREMMQLDPCASSIQAVADAVARSQLVKPHNNFLNTERVSFRGDGMVSALHFEYRFADMDMCPITAAAKCYLATAICLRAVELAKYGVVCLEPKAFARRCELLDALSTPGVEGAMSDTRRIDDRALEELKRQSLRMLAELRPTFTFFDPKVFKTLRILAVSPVSVLRHHGNGWEEVDNIFSSAVLTYDKSGISERLVQMIELFELTGCGSAGEWLDRAAAQLDVSKTYLGALMRDLGHRRTAQWDGDLKAMVFHY